MIYWGELLALVKLNQTAEAQKATAEAQKAELKRIGDEIESSNRKLDAMLEAQRRAGTLTGAARGGGPTKTRSGG